MSGNDIVGLTLAEIALVLLFSFLTVFMPAYARLSSKVDGKVDVATLQHNLDDARTENEKLKKEVENSRTNLRSVAIPSCAEMNKGDWLFTAVILGSDTYQIGGKPYSLESILNNYASELSAADKDGCRHRVKVYYDNSVSLREYDYALRRLEQHFYDLKLGSGS